MRGRRPGFRCLNELLVQKRTAAGVLRVVPDNMIVLDFPSDEELSSWAVDLQECEIFCVLEYISESNRRKDYVENFDIYETKLKVLYYLIFDPELKDLRLYKHNGTRYAPVAQNAAGRYPLPEVEMEVGLHDGWARFWHKGELLPLPAEMQDQLSEMSQRIEKERRAKERAEKKAERIARDNEKLTQQKDRLAKEKDKLADDNGLLALQKDRIAKDKADLQQALSDQQQAMAAMAAALRPFVEAKAQERGRQDVLEKLPTTNDGGQLARWLAEMA